MKKFLAATAVIVGVTTLGAGSAAAADYWFNGHRIHPGTVELRALTPQARAYLHGARGATGPRGPVGATGATGAQGPQGVPGAEGAQGAQGEQGPKGDTGAKGADGKSLRTYTVNNSGMLYITGTTVDAHCGTGDTVLTADVFDKLALHQGQVDLVDSGPTVGSSETDPSSWTFTFTRPNVDTRVYYRVVCMTDRP